jgi:hypothetical protein
MPPKTHPHFDPEWATPADWAAMYRAHGLQVVPAHMPRPAPAQWKRPELPEWEMLQNALAPDAFFQRMYGPQGRYISHKNMGILTGAASNGLYVVDLDHDKGPQAAAWWKNLIDAENNGIDPETVEQITGSGGRHKLFRWPSDRPVPGCFTNKVLNVDGRGKGGFIVAPPSLHLCGQSYRWAPGAAPWECEIAWAPEWLCDAIEALAPPAGFNIRPDAKPDLANRPTGQTDTNDFGLHTDGRDEYMRNMIWAALNNGEGMEETWQTYLRKTKTRLPGVSNEEGLEREGRGLSMFLKKWAYAFSKLPAPPAPTPPPAGPLVLTSSKFVAGFSPPAYLIDGMMQRGYLYALTARTGHGKTAIALLMAACIALGRPFHGVPVKQGSVLFCAGENPDDIRARWLVLSDTMGFDVDTIPVHFIAGVVDIAASMPAIKAAADGIKDLMLCVVDTAAAFFRGDDANSNAQQGAFARQLRQLTFLPGLPAVLVNCHPVKNATRENLVPAGGGAFLNEVDGNLTLWAINEEQSVLHWGGKFRGPEFDPLTFKMKTVESAKVHDADGRLMPSVVAEPVSQIEETFAEKKAERDEDALLLAIYRNKKASVSDLATVCGWVSSKGRPHKSKVARVGNRLADDKLLERARGKYRITAKGKKEIGVGDDENTASVMPKKWND